MAATVTSAWAKPGAWALEAEESEALEKQQQLEAAAAPSDFPSLATAAATKASKKKKKLSLAEFTTGHSIAPGAGRTARSDDILVLPTGPRERTAEELERGPSYRGFNSYGNREESGTQRWGAGRGSDEPRRGRGDAAGFPREPPPPSRADEIDDWGAMKKSSAPPPLERRERSGGFFDSQSRADDSDSWISTKSAAAPPSPANGRRVSDLPRERRGGFEFNKEGSSPADGDSWAKKREEPLSTARPKLVLQPRTLPNGVEQSVPATKSKSSNPFGAARPREEVLAEKGQDWKKIDEKLENMKIREPRPLSREGSGFGRRSSGSGSEDRFERNWRKDDAAPNTPPPPPESSEQAEQNASDN